MRQRIVLALLAVSWRNPILRALLTVLSVIVVFFQVKKTIRDLRSKQQADAEVEEAIVVDSVVVEKNPPDA